MGVCQNSEATIKWSLVGAGFACPNTQGELFSGGQTPHVVGGGPAPAPTIKR